MPVWRLARAAMALTVMVAAMGAVAPSAAAATLSLSVESEALHADMPFVLTLTAKGFEEEPAPEAPELVIDGCKVVYLGVSPSVSTRLEIVNGRRSEWRDLTFNYRWRVLAPAAGRYTVPALRLEQGDVAAEIARAGFDVAEVPSTGKMIVRLQLPDRPVWVGETFDVVVEWLITRDVDSYDFAVPLFDLDGAHVDGAASGGDFGRFTAGAQDIRLPLQRSTVKEGGRRYTRFAFPARVTLNAAGTVDLDPVRVVARLQTGTGRDSFGFRRPRYKLFGAEGARRRLTVRPLPQAGRPPTFVNAIGAGFAIDVGASRTVVSVGEPIQLTVSLRGAGPLTGLSLPPLAGPEALPTSQFSVPEGSTVGTVDEETGSKRFPVTVRVKSSEAREIPPIAFSYFDPGVGEYRTVTSEPIALSVGAGHIVGVADVVAAPAVTPRSGAAARHPETGAAGIATLLGADMSISEASRTFARPWGSDGVAALLGGLYGLPVLIALVSFWLSRTGARRTRNRDVRHALAALEGALGAGKPAREAAPAIIARMRDLASASGADPRTAAVVLERLETLAFDPAIAQQAVPGDVVEELRGIARGWSRAGAGAGGEQASRGLATASAAMVVVAVIATLTVAADDADAVAGARTIYQSALAESDRLLRVRRFAEAELALRAIARANPAAAELQGDWGNAALGAQEYGWAVLAWRRALRADPGNERASGNLAWLRDRLPVWLPRPASAGALDSLLFWRDRLTAAQLHLIGAAAFAFGVLVLVPGFGSRWRWRRSLAVPLALVWITAAGSAVLAGGDGNDAVVVLDGATLRSADSAGASPAFANPLPAGTEVTVLEDRGAWASVRLADGTRGWLSASAMERVAGSAD